MMGLTPVQAKCFTFIRDRLDASGVAPSFEEIKTHLSLNNRGRVVPIVNALVERGVIRRIAHKSRALEVRAETATSIVIDPLPEIQREIEKYAAEQGISVRCAVEEALRAYFAGPWAR